MRVAVVNVAMLACGADYVAQLQRDGYVVVEVVGGPPVTFSGESDTSRRERIATACFAAVCGADPAHRDYALLAFRATVAAGVLIRELDK